LTERLPGTDVALIGLGAAGGIAAHVLTEAGLDVVALEAGPRRAPEEMTLDEIRNDVRSWLARPKAAGEVPTWREGPSETAGPSQWPMLMVNAVGGTTVHYDAVSPRLLPWNFESASRTVERYGAGAIPAGSTIADWPLSYADLEPFYERVEETIGVGGAAGANPFEGPRRSNYPMPPLRRSGWNRLTETAAFNLGWHPYPAPTALNSEPYNGNPACTYCGFCASNGCYLNAKGSTDATVIPRAEATGRLRIETLARATRIEVDRDGLVSGVTYVKDGRARFQPARAVFLGTFVYENTRLLLLSKSRTFPHGIGNEHGQVGKHFIAHAVPLVFGLFPGRRLNVFSGPWSQATCVDDWNGDNFDHAALGFVGGGLLAAAHEAKPIALASAPPPPSVARWGSAWKRWLAANAQSIGSAVGQLESLAYEWNELDLDPHVTDPHGLPVVRVTYRVGESDRRGYGFLLRKLEAWLREAGAGETWYPDSVQLDLRHAYGGTRMGDDPETSVVDRYGFVHGSPNLAVISASTFPTSGGHNPTLTVQALAWRTAGHLVESWGSRSVSRAETVADRHL
jgi:gluconate 2-dehydrogenase alpha chain